MRIIDLPEFQDKTDVLTMTAQDPVLDACMAMKQRRVGSVLVTDKGKLTGIFTERDLLFRVVGEGKDLKNLTLKDVMTSNIKVAKPEDSVADSMRRMTQGRFRHLPVVDAQGKVIGILSQGDFAAHSWGDLMKNFKETARVSFMSNTQLWLLVLGIMVYFTVLLFAFKG